MVDVYLDAFAMMPEKEDVRKRIEARKIEDTPIKILMLGIDSISRLNLIRAMPSTRGFLQANGWYELAGYNKVIMLKAQFLENQFHSQNSKVINIF